MDTILKLLGLPSPAILLGVVASVLVSGLVGTGTGAYFGYQWARRAQAADVVAIQNEAIKAANTKSKAATKLAVQQIAREANARVRAAGIRRKGEIDATAKAKPECARDADSMRLLNESIAAANGDEPTGNGVPDPVPATSPTR